MQFKHQVKYLFILLFGMWSLCGQVSGQSINTQDLSKLKVDELSDEQIRSFLSQAQSSGLSESQMIQMAQRRGMPQAEMQKLQQRIASLGANTKKKGGSLLDKTTNQRTYLNGDSSLFYEDSLALSKKTPEQLREDSLRARIYGANLFLNVNPRFEPNLSIATPPDYIIGAGDELRIDIYGQSEASHDLEVTADGNINIPYVGVVNIGGATVQQATTRIKAKLSTVYSAINGGGTKVNISLGNIRSIKVIVTGEVVKPGTYTLPSVASVFNALYSSGGPTSKGSLRSIKVIRGGEEIADLDLYQFLQTGSMKGNVNLRDQDVIQVTTYTNRVELIGEVKRPLLFEVKAGEAFSDLLKYAGGFTEDAYTARVSAVRTTGRDYRIEDILESQFTQFEPKSGDKFTVERILDRFTNRILLEGAVFRPGQYELSPGLTLSMLIKKADGLKEDAYLKRGYIIRLKDDYQREQLSFNIAEVLAGTAEDITLKREDMVVVPSLFDLREEYIVKISGEVRNPGQYLYAEGMTLEELILQAGGFTEAASANRIEVARRMHNLDKEALSTSSRTAEVFNVDVNRELNTTGGSTFELKPFDLINVRSSTGYERQRTVRIEGEVLYPGEYTLSKKDERVSDLVKRAGGFTSYAYVKGASLKRKPLEQSVGDSTSKAAGQELSSLEELEKERIKRLQSLQMATVNPDSSNIQRSVQNNYVGIDLEQIMKDSGKGDDLLLEGGDIIRVPKQLQTVKISGEVLSPVTALYADGRGFKDYISQAGGFSQKALKRRSFVVYANGTARSTKKILFFNNYPKLEPGAEIFIPQRLPRERLGAAQLVGLGSGLASITAIIVTILRR